ncbi:MAG: flagellar motor switch protein FliN [Bryobacterales bacterium]|nr:flagellar motor switch protein FliN [Bryobacterales bacterium]
MDRAELRTWLLEEWSRRLADVIASMTEVRPEPRVTDPAPDSDEARLWHFIALDAAPGAGVLLGASPEDWFALGRGALEAAGLTEVSREDAEGTATEIAGQAAGAVSQTLTGRLEREVLSRPPVAAQPPDGPVAAGIGFLMGDQEIQILLAPNAALVDALAGALPAAARQEPETAPAASPAAPGPAPDSKTLDLLLDVELPVSVSFGRAQLPLRDVLKLNSGSIVELNRAVSEPVEIIVNNCVIARGEVVVVDGNYGVRIQQVVSREERLRTLH